ncbi:MAG: glycogen debranching enzyme N-terminal domain-containing protein [Bacteroidales bacterium]|nr:glycogen debranching enzyme N-terminal domain-containing protein [Bacteroidales bacterium]
MAFLKFNKSELVNLSYSLRREIILASKTGAYCNTSIVTCNTRRYHGLLASPVDRFGGFRYILLSSLDESLTLNSKRFNLGIHCYGGIYDPRGHKYIVDFDADPVPQITYKVGEIVFRKSIALAPDHNQVLIKYELVKAPAKVTLELKPFLAFRRVHDLTHENPEARTGYDEIPGGVAFRLYDGFPDLNLQLSNRAEFRYNPYWYKGVTYSDEMRRGFDCREDLFVPGAFTLELAPGGSVVFSADADAPVVPAGLKRKFTAMVDRIGPITSFHDQLVKSADLLIRSGNAHKQIVAGYSWLETGLLRETLDSLAGLTLYGKDSPKEFEEILDNLIADEQERLFHRTTQVEAPLCMTVALQQYIAYAGRKRHIWQKYGNTLKGIIESYAPGRRKEVVMQPDGLLWAQMDGVALSWMNAYIDGRAVTERAGYQVETNALWYNALCFALDMEAAYGDPDGDFVRTWTPVRERVEANFQPTFWNAGAGYLADYVDNAGQHTELRPNQIWAVSLDYKAVSDEVVGEVMRVVNNELVTRRGIRSLSPRDNAYRGVYEGSQYERDLAYHNGCAFPFLLAQFCYASFNMMGAGFVKRAEWLTEGFYEDLSKHGVGAFSELYDGDPPHEAHGAVSSALSTAALLHIDWLIQQYKEA